MSATALAALPANGDSATWSVQEAALVEAAGLSKRQGSKTVLAPRPVVEAFLMHCQRTGLDPIARQIYCIERGGKWGTQISIDGARLVAERSGQYLGRTAYEFTSDGDKWVQAWIPSIHGEHPEAARVGVRREGFPEPVYAVTTWDSYQAGGPMWKKMPALMLGKCAEMLALRTAFPMELSGLYSTEEMDQAGQPKPAAVVSPASDENAAAAAKAELVPDVWLQRASATTFLGPKQIGAGGLRALYLEATKAEVIKVRVAEDSAETFGDVLMRRAAGLPEDAPDDTVDAEIVDEPEADSNTGEVIEWPVAKVPSDAPDGGDAA